MTRESCCNYLLSLDSEDLLVSMTKSLIFQVSTNAKMILSFLFRYLPPNYHSYFKLTTEEFEDMLQSLEMMVERGILEEELVFSAVEILHSFKYFIQFEPNRQVMAYSAVYKSIAYLLKSGDATEQKAACELLWKLVTKPVGEDTIVITPKRRDIVEEVKPDEYLSEPGIQSFLLQHYPEIPSILSKLSQDAESHITLYSCTRLVLMEESVDVIGKGVHLLAKWLLISLVPRPPHVFQRT